MYRVSPNYDTFLNCDRAFERDYMRQSAAADGHTWIEYSQTHQDLDSSLVMELTTLDLWYLNGVLTKIQK